MRPGPRASKKLCSFLPGGVMFRYLAQLLVVHNERRCPTAACELPSERTTALLMRDGSRPLAVVRGVAALAAVSFGSICSAMVLLRPAALHLLLCVVRRSSSRAPPSSSVGRSCTMAPAAAPRSPPSHRPCVPPHVDLVERLAVVFVRPRAAPARCRHTARRRLTSSLPSPPDHPANA